MAAHQNLETSTVFSTYPEMERAAAHYREMGCVVLPADSPLKGSVGYSVFMQPTSEVGFHLEWLPFGRVAETHVETIRSYDAALGTYNTDVILEHLLRLTSKRIFKADDLRTREIGFVYYESGSAHCIRFPLTSLKGARDLMVGGVPFINWRDSVPDLRSAATTS
jgi:hypothetical protein